MSTVETQVGSVVWHEQVSSEPERAQRFYTELLGWEVEQWKPGEADYPIIKANGQTHGGFTRAEGGAPAGWIAHVLVDDVDEAAARAESLGGTTVSGPTEMAEIGRWAIIADPQGGVISAYKPGGEYDVPAGTFVWDELLATDVDVAKRFYPEVFNWTTEDFDPREPGRYTIFNRRADTGVAGLSQKPPGAPGAAVWIPYLAREDVDGTVARAKELGATVLIEPYDVENAGRMSVLVDPSGATFGLIRPSPRVTSEG
jgi:uncharacterized protein